MMTRVNKKIVHVFWESDNSCLVILGADFPEVLPPILLKSAGLQVGVLERLNETEVGSYYGFYRSAQNYVFTVCPEDDCPDLLDLGDRLFLAADFNNWGEAIGNPEWELLPVDGKAKSRVYELNIPIHIISEKGSFRYKFVTEKGQWLNIPGKVLNAVQSPDRIVNFEFNPNQTGLHCFRFRMPKKYVPIGNEQVVWQDGEYVERYDLTDLERLLQASTDLPLGAIVDKDQTTFRLFAPRACEVHLLYGFEADQSDVTFVNMQCIEGVTWECTLHENLTGAYYSFRVQGDIIDGTTNFDAFFDVLDPYAKSCLGNLGPGIVVDPGRLKKVKKQYKAPPLEDLVILEGHVRDLVAKAPIELSPEDRQGFTGLCKWVQSEGSYLRELGVNAVELQPVQQIGDFINKGYHWGYMPANYFSLESNYAAEAENASQIEAFRDLIRTFHDQGMAVILDVVYNHVGEPYHLAYIDKYYYFHLHENGEMINWSGCGNDLRCDTPMMRRLIIESLKHFVEVYDVDGFRFDLAELIGVDVLRAIEKELKKIKPSIILIAEPWSFRGHIQDELRESEFASWNDGFRESITRYVCGEGTAEVAQYYLSGSPESSRFVAQTINYTESHDDHCWIDRITRQPGQDGSSPTWLDQRRTHLMASLLFVSLGVPMLAEGQDFMRSKLGISNTYQRGDLNALDYERQLIHSGTHTYFREWIRFRLSKSGKALRYKGPLQAGYLKFFSVEEGSSAIVAVFNADRSVKAPQLVFAINPHENSQTIQCDAVYLKDALQIADQERFDANGLSSARILMNGEAMTLPAYSCGLWLTQH